jgi:hypothetical protein
VLKELKIDEILTMKRRIGRASLLHPLTLLSFPTLSFFLFSEFL